MTIHWKLWSHRVALVIIAAIAVTATLTITHTFLPWSRDALIALAAFGWPITAALSGIENLAKKRNKTIKADTVPPAGYLERLKTPDPIPPRFKIGNRVRTSSYSDDDPSHTVESRTGTVVRGYCHSVMWDDEPHAIFAMHESGLRPIDEPSE